MGSCCEWGDGEKRWRAKRRVDEWHEASPWLSRLAVLCLSQMRVGSCSALSDRLRYRTWSRSRPCFLWRTTPNDSHRHYILRRVLSCE